MLTEVLAIVAAILAAAFGYWLKRQVPAEEYIFTPPETTLEWSALAESTHMGDDIGDAFLEDVGPAAIYGCESLIELAAASGGAGQSFSDQFTIVPHWVDMEAVDAGAAFLRRWIDIYGVSGVGTIIESYGYSVGANILIETGRLSCSADATRRLLETGLFNLDIIEHGLNRSKSVLGQEAIARVRMLHCMVRRHIRQSCSWWDTATMGVPVNQEDGAHTIFLNSIASLRAMEMQCLPISSSEKNSVSMFWAYCGHMMGIHEKFLAKNYHQEMVLYQTIFDHSFHPSEASHKLTAATVDGLSGLPPYYFDTRSISALARMSLGESNSCSLHIEKTERFRDHLLVSFIRSTVILRWFLFSYFYIYWNSMPYLRWTVNLALKYKGYEIPKYHFFVTSTRKNEGLVRKNTEKSVNALK